MAPKVAPVATLNTTNQRGPSFVIENSQKSWGDCTPRAQSFVKLSGVYIKEINMPEILNQTIPQFSAQATTGEITSEMFKDRYTVLYFYPKDNTSGCTMEGRDFAALYSQFKEAGCEVIGVSRDSIKSHNNFCI